MQTPPYEGGQQSQTRVDFTTFVRPFRPISLAGSLLVEEILTRLCSFRMQFSLKEVKGKIQETT